MSQYTLNAIKQSLNLCNCSLLHYFMVLGTAFKGAFFCPQHEAKYLCSYMAISPMQVTTGITGAVVKEWKEKKKISSHFN